MSQTDEELISLFSLAQKLVAELHLNFFALSSEELDVFNFLVQLWKDDQHRFEVISQKVGLSRADYAFIVGTLRFYQNPQQN